MKKKYSLTDIRDLQIDIKKPSIIFLYWDLWAGKTTLYNKYEDIYHFDLYRLWDYEEFCMIWWEEILDNNEGIILIEWPEILKPYYTPDISIRIEKTLDDDIREYSLTLSPVNLQRKKLNGMRISSTSGYAVRKMSKKSV